MFADLFWKRKKFDKRKIEKNSPNGKRIAKKTTLTLV
jgi:hypothetical protein